VITDDSRQPGYDSDRFEIMRTVEMESWTESRLANHKKMGHGFDITTEDHSRAMSPADSMDMKNGIVHGSSSSTTSSISGPSDKHYAFEIGQAR
jgi:hypothetical protein